MLLLARGGCTAYWGAREECEAYFESLGFECPATTNPPDFYLDILAGRERPTRASTRRRAGSGSRGGAVRVAAAEQPESDVLAPAPVPAAFLSPAELGALWTEWVSNTRFPPTEANEEERTYVEIEGRAGGGGGGGGGGSSSSSSGVVGGETADQQQQLRTRVESSTALLPAGATYRVPRRPGRGGPALAERQTASFGAQLWLFLRRALLQHYRQWPRVVVNLFLHLLIGAVVGASFWAQSRSANKPPLYLPPVAPFVADSCPEVVRARCNAEPLSDKGITQVSFIVTLTVVGASAIAALVTFGHETAQARREAEGGVLLPAYFLAKALADLPILVLATSIMTAFLYLFVHLNPPYAFVFLLYFLVNFAATGMGYVISLLARRENATVMACFATIFWASFAGVTPSLHDVHKAVPWLIWIWAISFPRWSSEALVGRVGSGGGGGG